MTGPVVTGRVVTRVRRHLQRDEASPRRRPGRSRRRAGTVPRLALLPALTEVHRAAFGAPPANEGEAEVSAFRDQSLPRHAGREDFALAVAREDPGVAGDPARLVGFAYSCTGRRGQYWSDLVAGALPADVAAVWVGGHTEVVEVAVHPERQRRGTGRRLLETLLGASPNDRALVGTHRVYSPARGLYLRTGWAVLGDAGDSTVLGRVLRPPT